MGNPEYVICLCKSLYESKEFEFLGIVCNEAKQKGRNRKKNLKVDPKVAQWHKQNALNDKDIFLLQTNNICTESNLQFIHNQQADIIITAAFGQILTQKFLDIAKYGVLNIHPSQLPKHRGATPVVDTILSQSSKTAVTFIKTVLELDAGDIVMQVFDDVLAEDTACSLLHRLFNLSALNLATACTKLIASSKDKSLLKKQQKDLVSYCYKIKKSDGLLNPKLDAQTLYNKYRAYYPWPGCFFFIGRQHKRLLIKKMQLTNKKSEFCGFMKYDNNYKHLIIGTSSYDLIVNKVCLAGKKPQSAQEFYNGFKKINTKDGLIAIDKQ